MSPLPCSDLIAIELPFTKKEGSILDLNPAIPIQTILISLWYRRDTLNDARFSTGNKSVEAQIGV